MSVRATEVPMEAVERMGPVIREHAGAAEAGGRLARPVIDAMRDAGLFRLLLPRSLGGLEVDPVTFALVVEAVSRHDSAAGWLLQAATLGDWWGARFPEDGVEEMLGQEPDALMAAAFAPPVAGEPAGGGYRITGRRPLASSIHDARWLLVTAVVGDGAIAAVCHAHEAEVVDTWCSLGMRGTDSQDVVLQDVFVPVRRTFPLVPAFTPGPHHQGPLYRMSAVSIQSALLGAIAIAIAEEALAALRDLAPGKMSLGSSRALRDRTSTHSRLGRAAGLVRSARALLHGTLAGSWEVARAGRAPEPGQRAGDLLAGAQAVAASVEAVDLMFAAAGSSAVYERSPIERHFRDIQTLRHHGFVCESRFEAVGQVMLELEPEFAFIAF